VVSVYRHLSLLCRKENTTPRARTTIRTAILAVARNKATVTEFKAVLTPDQLKRANQLAAQIVWSDRGFGGPPGFNLQQNLAPGYRSLTRARHCA